MKIGELVKRHIKRIFSHCDNVSHKEFDALLDPIYSNRTFGINFPFCIELKKIEPGQSRRYWTEVHLVRGKRVRVTNDWYERSRQSFTKYLKSKGIEPEIDLPAQEQTRAQDAEETQAYRTSSQANSRYRGNHIGNAQNLFIRNILSNLGHESFRKENWNSTKKHFSGKCVYCGDLATVMDHAIPINKERLGEHRLGNLVPSCKQCNQTKGAKDFRAFLEGNTEAISKIKKYMDDRNYVPLEDNEQIQKILNMAHKEVAALADRYITIVNELFSDSASA